MKRVAMVVGIAVAALAVPASLRGRTVQADTVERGVSRKGPRSTVRRVRIR